MSKNLAKDAFYQLPSGASVHPCRLIFKDGTLMWKHVLLAWNVFTSLPLEHAHEAHIIKTAQRIEELNTWVSQELEPWECLTPHHWYDPSVKELSEGISLYFTHKTKPLEDVFHHLLKRLNNYETLEVRGSTLFFKRC